MNKYILTLMTMSSLTTFAADLSDFQAFDNVINIGFGVQQDEVSQFGMSSMSKMSNSQMYSLEGERILNNGIYIDVLANMAFTSTPTNLMTPGVSLYGVNGKVGYTFQVVDSHLLLTPYGLFGMNSNSLTIYNNISNEMASSSMAMGITQQSVGSRYFLTYGFGGRIEYRINDYILVYGDQNFMMNNDQSQYMMGVGPQNTNAAMSTIGVKFNLVDLFQVGVKGMYTNYMPQGSNMNPMNNMTISQPMSSMAGMVTLGLTY